jgi:hypothetical protein
MSVYLYETALYTIVRGCLILILHLKVYGLRKKGFMDESRSHFQPIIRCNTAMDVISNCKSFTTTEKVIGMFTPSVWFTMAVVIVLTTLVFWRTSNGPACAVTESHTYRTVLHCAYNVWSTFLGLSVSQMPMDSFKILL